MAVFDVLGFFEKMVGAGGLTSLGPDVVAWLDENAAKYPDTRGLTDALAAFITEKVNAAGISAAMLRDTIWGAASDIAHGKGSADAQAWQGAG